MRSLVICGSMRFKDDIKKFVSGLKDCRVGIVLEPDFEDLSDDTVHKEEVERLKEKRYRERVPGLVLSHLWKKIAPADVVYIFNKDGYIGHNTLGELFFAVGKEKYVCAYDEQMLVDGTVREICAEILVNEVVKEPSQLSKLLA